MIIGIMGAMPDEVDQLCARLADVTKENYAGVEYHCGTLQGKQVVVIQMVQPEHLRSMILLAA